jgi:hypothetical protein
MTDPKRRDATGRVPDRSLRTIAQYRRRGQNYVRQIRQELEDPDASLGTIVDFFLTLDARYKPSSQRTITAWLRQVVDDETVADPTNIALKDLRHRLDAGCGPALVAQLQSKLGLEGSHIQQLVAGFLSADRQYTARAQIAMARCLSAMIKSEVDRGRLSNADSRSLLAQVQAAKPKPKARPRTQRTSAKKRKEVALSDFKKVVRRLSCKGDKLNVAASYFLKLNVFFGLRPGEWRTAYLRGNTLYWTAEKTTNGRGNVDNPYVDIQRSQLGIESLRSFLDFLKPYRDNEQEWLRLFERLRSRIAYACEKEKVARIAPYTTRDLFIASQLLNGTDPIEVAAKANHKSVRSHRRHYASKRSGYKMSYNPTTVDRKLVANIIPLEPFSLDKLGNSHPQLRR